ncbi:carboxypeptidase regulatory-like domain-containing protein [Bremerella cremea]|uniref:Carboxypeptidase regulatory-like domain-containing protein n=1 Tax=Bremerella cremea TaxID=1031537 RepID=A0A368KTJ8_9BACT|nr:carboxypeptidase-like regulatory domain-containing protein [Bremerella cremea]RCS52990.1 carboxypeptidase regulatory-like domain-containing protein [Bremerella cremea]
MKRISLLATVCLATMLGCFGGNSDLQFGEVKGHVTLEGKPLPHATVRFQPESGRPSYGKTDESGEYTLKFKGQELGALVGQHSVAITTEDRIENPETGESRWQKEILPPKYNSETTLSAVVEPGENVFDFDLVERKKK